MICLTLKMELHVFKEIYMLHAAVNHVFCNVGGDKEKMMFDRFVGSRRGSTGARRQGTLCSSLLPM